MSPEPPIDRADPIIIGRDGVAMLVLSTAIAVLSLGVSLLCCFGYILWLAVHVLCVAASAPIILVPGMRLDGNGKPGPDYRARLKRAATLHAAAPSSRIVLLGGRTSVSSVSEAAAGRHFLSRRGISRDLIQTEDGSRHTLENLWNYRMLAGGYTTPVLLISNRFHLARCSLLASGLGIRHRLVAAEARRLPSRRHVALMLFEAVLIHWYLTGRTFARLTRNRRMAARIS